MRTLSLAAGTLLTVLTFSVTDAQAASTVTKGITAAVADPARPDVDRKRDIDRKPAESVAFAGLKPGQSIVDLLPGGGYFTRIFSVVPDRAAMSYAISPPRRPESPADRPDPAAATQAIAADAHYSNVTVLVQRLTDLSVPKPVDIVWTSRNYHDLHNIPNVDVAAIDKKIFDSLKPGGTFIVLDHAAEKGSASVTLRLCIVSMARRSGRKSSPRASSSSLRAKCCATRTTRTPRRCSMPPCRTRRISSS